MMTIFAKSTSITTPLPSQSYRQQRSIRAMLTTLPQRLIHCALPTGLEFQDFYLGDAPHVPLYRSAARSTTEDA